MDLYVPPEKRRTLILPRALLIIMAGTMLLCVALPFLNSDPSPWRLTPVFVVLAAVFGLPAWLARDVTLRKGDPLLELLGNMFL